MTDINILKEIQKFGNRITGMLPSTDKLTVTEWMCKYMRDPRNPNEPFTFNGREYMLDILNDESPEQVVHKGAQVGVTESYVRWCIHKPAAYGNVTMIYTMPTETDVQEFSSQRYNPMVDVLEQVFPVKGDINNAGLKQILDGYIYFRGTFGKGRPLSVPADFLLHDELDKSNMDIVSQYSSRLENSKIGWVRTFSTPTFANFGIDALFRKSDQKWWLNKCYRCNHWIAFAPEDMKIVKGSWQFVCPNCGRVVDKFEMKGEYVAKHPDRTGISGFHISKLQANVWDAESIKRSEKRYEKIINPTQHIYNYVYGLTYDSPDLVPFSIDLMQESLITIPRVDRSHGCYIGIDNSVEKHVVVVEVTHAGWQIVDAFICDTSDGIYLIKQAIEKYNPFFCGIDPLPDISFAEWVRELLPKVYYVWFRDIKDLTNTDERELTITLHKNLAINRVSNALKEKQLTIADYILESYPDFLQQFNNIKGEKNDAGVTKYQNFGLPDHFAMATIYSLAGDMGKSHLNMMIGVNKFPNQ